MNLQVFCIEDRETLDKKYEEPNLRLILQKILKAFLDFNFTRFLRTQCERNPFCNFAFISLFVDKSTSSFFSTLLTEYILFKTNFPRSSLNKLRILLNFSENNLWWSPIFCTGFQSFVTFLISFKILDDIHINLQNKNRGNSHLSSVLFEILLESSQSLL